MSTEGQSVPSKLISAARENDPKRNEPSTVEAAINHDSSEQTQKQQLALPSADMVATTQAIKLSGSDDVKHTIRFDNLGPLVINKDGTLSRINNWAQMSDSERERTVRVLGKRNMLRKEAILNDEEPST